MTNDTRSAAATGLPILPRRGFLRGLLALPLFGAGVAAHKAAAAPEPEPEPEDPLAPIFAELAAADAEIDDARERFFGAKNDADMNLAEADWNAAWARFQRAQKQLNRRA